ncbi:hypothetical protein PCC7424_3474 [Gloeothece citriformis PCC 7424]|uniref:Uncharacterized protein n=1 Tax=Gloeothece citriformis (strain PCC 7424) TaxID=65393 RepID=B7KFF1_GLOC7|nr:hypothetical protein [Gloeothece citriformis]ACK71867.1 hypothetical protein PCC7424_3474 [Gloeothece citriformis PCC 7424]
MNKSRKSRKRFKYLSVVKKLMIWVGKTAFLIGISFLIIFISVEFLIPTQPRSVFSDATVEENQPQEILPPSPSIPHWLTSSEEPSYSKAGQPLTPEERQYISHILGEINPPTSPLEFEQMPLFILHDTSGEIDIETINEKKRQAIGPYGDGIAAYIPREGEAIITRPGFFNRDRPTATAYEKALDITSEKNRDQQVHQIWKLINNHSKQIPLKEAINDINLDQSILFQRAKVWLETPSEKRFNQLKKRLNLDGAKTAGLWTVRHICQSVLSDDQSALILAKSSKDIKPLKNSCQKVIPVLSTSHQRVRSSVHIELIQKRGSECYTTNAQVKHYNSLVSNSLKIPNNKIVPLQTLTRPAYTVSQYQNLTLLYLRSALEAGYFPKITTHFWVDRGEVGLIGDHCDPRGLDLNYFYQMISETLGDSWGTIYGIEPNYGLDAGQGHNVWWSDEIMGTFPPF